MVLALSEMLCYFNRNYGVVISTRFLTERLC